MYTLYRPDNVDPSRLESIDVYEYADIDKKLKSSLLYQIAISDPIERKKKLDYLPLPATLDIETTTIPVGHFLNRSDRPFAFTYSYQIYIAGYQWILRTEEEFMNFMEAVASVLDEHALCLVWYVHNLSFEFQFLKKVLKTDFSSVFALQTRRIGKFLAYDGHMEFRCSYLLSNMSLEKFTENFCDSRFRKDKDLIDYEIIRFPWTKLDNNILYYSAMDTITLYQAVISIMEKEGDDLKSIPLTNTGYVRRSCRSATLGDYQDTKNPDKKRKIYRYKHMMEKCSVDLDIYRMLEDAFRGGNTHANRFIIGKLLTKDKGLTVGSVDLTSAYPAVMICSGDFPMGKLTECTESVQKIPDLEYYCRHYWIIVEAVFEDLELRDPYHTPLPYIPIGKVKREKWTDEKGKIHMKGGIYDNGRIIKQDGYLTYTFLGCEWETIKKQYKGKIKITKAYYTSKGYLPDDFRKTIYDWFLGKTSLKNVQGKEYEYMRSKNRINSCYGMTVEKIIKFMIECSEDGILTARTPTEEEALKQIEDFKNPMRRKFLLYQWGITVTALVRMNHMTLVDITGRDFVYGDTDSVKFINPEKYLPEIEKYNETWIRYAKECGVPFQATAPNGSIQTLGVADYEGCYDSFITLGAKKYADVVDGKLDITVAGIPKKIGAKLLGDIHNFREDFVFMVGDDGGLSDRQSWKKCLTYRDDTDFMLVVGKNAVHVGSCIAMERIPYHLGLSDDFRDLTGYNGQVTELDDVWY